MPYEPRTPRPVHFNTVSYPGGLTLRVRSDGRWATIQEDGSRQTLRDFTGSSAATEARLWLDGFMQGRDRASR